MPNLTQPTDTDQKDAPLAPGEQYASPEEEHLLGKVMGAFYHMINAPKTLRMIEGWLLKGQAQMGATIGGIAFRMLMSIYDGAKHAGTVIPPDIFFAQGGAVYQAIDRLILIAQHAGLHVDEEKVREDAMGTVVDSVKKSEGQIKAPPQQGGPQQPQDGMPPAQFGAPAAAANPLSHAVNQGLLQQGMGAQQ